MAGSKKILVVFTSHTKCVGRRRAALPRCLLTRAAG